MPTLTDFFTLLEKSNLLAPQEVASLRQHSADPISIAQQLNEEGRLTKWQAEQLLAGHHSFFLGKYKLLEKLGEGGMGAVYKAEQFPLTRTVVLKVMSEKVLNQPHAVQRFHREIQSVSLLNHPNIIAAVDADQVGNSHFLVMEYVPGSDLKKWIRQYGQLPLEWSCEVVRQTALGLQHAYDSGIVHRDIKPSTLLCDDLVHNRRHVFPQTAG